MMQLDKNRGTVTVLVQEIGNTYFKFLKLQEALEQSLADLETLQVLPYINEAELEAHVKELSDTFHCYQALADQTINRLHFYTKKVPVEG